MTPQKRVACVLQLRSITHEVRQRVRAVGRLAMKANVLALALLSLCACDQSQTVPPDTSHVVTTAIHDCAKQRFASINANGGTFTLTSTCEAVFVNGGNNRITIEASKKVIVDGGKNVMEIIASDQVTVNGEGNTIKFKRGLRKTSAVVAVGDNNNVIQEK